MRRPGKTAVLLATYEGERFLEQQLASLARQTVAEIDVWASDDGSTDATTSLLAAWAGRWPKGRFAVLGGPRRGFAENFRSLLINPGIEADYFTFCDQDDLWDPDKLEVAIDWLAAGDSRQPRVHCSRTRLIDRTGQQLGRSPLFARPPDFRNAIVQSIAGGNTMVLNRAARDLIAEASRRTGFVAHDWWTYMIVTGAGGEVHYSVEPRVSYRQHGGNLIGENNSWRARLRRFRGLTTGRFRQWHEENLAGLERCLDMLTEEARATLAAFKLARSGSLPVRLWRLLRSGVYRQTRFGQAGLFVACLLGRL